MTQLRRLYYQRDQFHALADENRPLQAQCGCFRLQRKMPLVVVGNDQTKSFGKLPGVVSSCQAALESESGNAIRTEGDPDDLVAAEAQRSMTVTKKWTAATRGEEAAWFPPK